MTHLKISPNREKIISRSASLVAGLSLHTNSTFSGGATSASGRSPSCITDVSTRHTQSVEHTASYNFKRAGTSLGFLAFELLINLLLRAAIGSIDVVPLLQALHDFLYVQRRVHVMPQPLQSHTTTTNL